MCRGGLHPSPSLWPCDSLQSVPASLVLGGQNWTQHLRCGLTSAEERGGFTSLHLLAVLLLMQPGCHQSLLSSKGTLLARVHLSVCQDPQGLFCRAASSWVAPSMCWCPGWFLTGRRIPSDSPPCSLLIASCYEWLSGEGVCLSPRRETIVT